MILQMRRIKSKDIIRLLLYVIILHSLVFAVTLNAQNGNPPMQLQPADGSLGLPGIVSGSWIMSWSSVPGVAYYQWVNSNNHLCFYGCAGDTRSENTTDTNGVVYYIPNQEWRYWIVRAILTNGDTTSSSPIHSFRATKANVEDIPLFTISSNPSHQYISLSVEWYINPKVSKLNVNIYTIDGIIIEENISLLLNKNLFIRKEIHQLPTIALSKGIYIVRIADDATFQEYVLKAVVE